MPWTAPTVSLRVGSPPRGRVARARRRRRTTLTGAVGGDVRRAAAMPRRSTTSSDAGSIRARAAGRREDRRPRVRTTGRGRDRDDREGEHDGGDPPRWAPGRRRRAPRAPPRRPRRTCLPLGGLLASARAAPRRAPPAARAERLGGRGLLLEMREQGGHGRRARERHLAGQRTRRAGSRTSRRRGPATGRRALPGRDVVDRAELLALAAGRGWRGSA